VLITTLSHFCFKFYCKFKSTANWRVVFTLLVEMRKGAPKINEQPQGHTVNEREVNSVASSLTLEPPIFVLASPCCKLLCVVISPSTEYKVLDSACPLALNSVRTI
jgi:hypothetical protein